MADKQVGGKTYRTNNDELYQLREEWTAEQGKNSKGTAEDLNEHGYIPKVWQLPMDWWEHDPIMPATIIAHLALRYPERLTTPQIAKELMRLYRKHRDPQPLVQFRRLQLAVSHVTRSCEFPVMRTAGTTSNFSRHWARRHQPLYRVSPEAATVFLCHYIAELRVRDSPVPAAFKPFRLMDLPQELRDQIYAFVLHIPRSEKGLAIHRDDRRDSMVVSVLNEHEDNYPRKWTRLSPGNCLDHNHAPCYMSERPNSTIFLEGSNKQLHSLSRTCKSVHCDALSIFFGTNNFVCGCLLHLRDFLLNLSGYRRDLIKTITIFYENCRTDLATQCFAILGRMEKLRDLHVYLDTWQFNEGRKRYDRKKEGLWYGTDLMKLPGMDLLLALNASGQTRITLHLDSHSKDTFDAAVASAGFATKSFYT